MANDCVGVNNFIVGVGKLCVGVMQKVLGERRNMLGACFYLLGLVVAGKNIIKTGLFLGKDGDPRLRGDDV